MPRALRGQPAEPTAAGDPAHGRHGRPAHARPHACQEGVRQATGQIAGACARVVHQRNHRDVARRLHSCRACPDLLPNGRSRGLAMRWPGHKGVPGVAPERAQRPKDASTHRVMQRRGAERYRTRRQPVTPNRTRRPLATGGLPTGSRIRPALFALRASAGWRMPARRVACWVGMPADLGMDVAPDREHPGLINARVAVLAVLRTPTMRRSLLPCESGVLRSAPPSAAGPRPAQSKDLPVAASRSAAASSVSGSGSSRRLRKLHLSRPPPRAVRAPPGVAYP